jgi:hypothetical protein
MDYHTSKENNMELLATLVFIIMYIFGLASAIYALATLIWFTSGDVFNKKMKIIKARRKGNE